MNTQATIGRMLFAAVAMTFGVQCLIFSSFVAGLEPVPATLLPSTPWGAINGLVLIGVGLSLLADRSARIGALVLAALFIVSAILLEGPSLIAHPKAAADDVFHTLAIGSAALVLTAEVARSPDASGRDRWMAYAGLAGRLIFGVCTIGHGVMHFVFFQFTADFIPAWIPWHAFWAAFTGVAQIAAGLAILSGVLARLAATLTGVMYASWAVIVHIPRVEAHPASRQEWTSIVIATALCASALVVAGVFKARRDPVRTEELATAEKAEAPV
ncbi:MAG TPA: DoxX family protein [Phenylobacterium sp.]|uniref:DoxX family protein n=1 Tax=Phenylobacterium sp. TaxID=1871053 RepID=UPI002D4AABD9|nr:DoxX family protein [Phenylobacterium sp.]HZZ69651.1 DoxX family protein [Phenylobacterium sp.]